MKILLTNDDGFSAKGILSLAEYLVNAGHEVTVCAPLTEKSGAGHSITFVNDFVYKEHKLVKGAKCYSLNGTPIDCVRFALFVLCGDVDIVLSGINNILNLGTDYIYSGTVNAAIEGTICNKKSIGISTNSFDGNYDFPCQFIIENLDLLLSEITTGVTLNVNIPYNYKEQIKGVKICPIGVRNYEDKYIPILNEGVGEIYHLQGSPISKLNSKDFDDVSMSDKGYITITPIKHISTDIDALNALSKKEFKL